MESMKHDLLKDIFWVEVWQDLIMNWMWTMKRSQKVIPELSDPEKLGEWQITHIHKEVMEKEHILEKKDIKDSGFDMINFINIFISKKLIN